ncbi:14436_t:CDS:2 [Cetraspora pellucida]|uniref:14436_t:CDS:1 n=1 Tax=Cetraspora pellucida TaxID=1433469 RepID=A0A9N9JWI8_9GLOM|nr:14436_t:CDS:2 [Cetraspora pellucida]
MLTFEPMSLLPPLPGCFALKDMSDHLSSQQLSMKEQQRVQPMSALSIHPQKMLSTLHQDNSNLAATSKTIYNALDKIRHDYLQGRMPIQTLLDKLKEKNFEYDY